MPKAHEKTYGVDISHYQDTKLFAELIQSKSIKFIIHKATEGRDYTDPQFIERAKKAKKSNILWGAYHFFGIMSQHDPIGQVDHFLKNLNASNCPTLPIFDLEQYTGKHSSYYGQRPPLAAAETMVDYFVKQTGVQPIIYGNPSDLEAIIDGHATTLTQYPLWIAHYNTSQPRLPNNQFGSEQKVYWQDYAIWQYAEKPYDQNWFNGSEAALRVFWEKHSYVPCARQKNQYTTQCNATLFTLNKPTLPTPVEGVSLSRWQTDTLFEKDLSNQTPMFIRATLGVNDKDNTFHKRAIALYQHNQKRANSLPWGAWHLFSSNPASHPIDQAKDFLKAIQDAATEASAATPALLAVTLAKSTKGQYPTIENIQAFLTHIEQQTGIKMIIQGNQADLKQIFKDNDTLLKAYPVYIQKWSHDAPTLSIPYTFWEYTKEPYLKFQFQGNREELMSFWQHNSYTPSNPSLRLT